MFIRSTDRTPEYFGAVAASLNISMSANPYIRGNRDLHVQADPRHGRWNEGYLNGHIERPTVGQQQAGQPLSTAAMP